MKKILSVLALGAALAFCSCAGPQRGNYSAPSAAVIGQRVNTAGERVAAAQASTTKAQAHAKAAKEKVAQIETVVPKTSENAQLILSLKQEIDGLTDELLNTQVALQSAQDELTKAKTVDIPKLQQEVNAQTELLNKTIGEKNALQVKYDAAAKSYHKLKFWIIGVAAAATVFLIYSLFHFAAFSPPILYLTLGAPIAVSTFLLFYL